MYKKISISTFKKIFLNFSRLMFSNFVKRFLIFFAFIFSIFTYDIADISANSNISKINIYINDSKELKTKKRKNQIDRSKSKGQKINSFFKQTSQTKNKKNKNNLATEKMLESELTTRNMVKKNRWFVKKPFQNSYTKISNIKRVNPPRNDIEEKQNISLKASELSKNRSSESGYNKPDEIFSSDSGRRAKLMSTTLTKSSTPTKKEPIYSEDFSRKAMEISITRARLTGPIKPKKIYSEEVGREAFKLSSKKNKNKKNIEQNYSENRYSVEFLRSLSRKPTKKNEFLNEGPKTLKKNKSE